MKTGIKIIDAMTEKPVSVLPNTSLRECAKLMAKEHVGALLIKSNNSLFGIVTEQDIVRKAVSEGLDTEKTEVSLIMEKNLTTINPDNDIFDALVLMRDLNIRHLPVTDNKKFIGLLTLKDILKIEPQLFDIMVEKFEIREEERKPIHRFIPTEGICEGCGEYSEKLNNIKGSLLCDLCKAEQS